MIVTDVATVPDVTDKLVMTGVIENAMPLLGTLLTVTTRLPVAAPGGTEALIELALQIIEFADVPSKVTVLVPWLTPKPVPEIVSEVPATPEVEERLVMFGTTVNCALLLATPATVTMI